MANDLNESTVNVVSASAGGLATGLENIAIIGPSSIGPLLAPRVISSGKSEEQTFGYGEAPELSAHYIKRVGKKIVRVRVASATAGSIGASSDDFVTGTSVVTFTGTPNRRYSIAVEVVAGGTIGVQGITLRVSLNGGVTWGSTFRLGTATSYVIPKTGITINFAAGTLIALDRATAETVGPKANNAGHQAAVAALIDFNVKFRALIFTGEFTRAEADALQVHVDSLYTAGFRPQVFIAARDWYADARMTGAATLAFAAGGPGTITRSTGSFLVDGFKAGMSVTPGGTTVNTGTYTIASLTATVITLSAGDTITTEAAAGSRTLVGEELESTWVSSLLADFTGFNSAGRVSVSAGMAWMTSEIHQELTRVPAYLAAVERWMQHDIQVAMHRKSDGALTGFSIYEPEFGAVSEHDARANDALNEARFLVLRSYTNNPRETYVSLSSSMAPDGSALGVIPWLAVANLMADVVQKATENFIGDNPATNDDGTLTGEELGRYSDIVNDELAAELLSAKTEGPRASSVNWTPSDESIVNIPNSILQGVGELRTLGLIGSVNTTVYVNPPAN